MKPALSVIDLIPNIHRTPALSMLRRAVLDGRPLSSRLDESDRQLAFHEAQVALTSPIGARILRDLYHGGHLKLKKPSQKSLPALEAYIATEGAFRAQLDRIVLAEDAKRTRLAAIIADPDCARPDELNPWLIDRVISAHLGHGTSGGMQIAGLACHRAARPQAGSDDEMPHAGGEVICWWQDGAGQRHGDSE